MTTPHRLPERPSAPAATGRRPEPEKPRPARGRAAAGIEHEAAEHTLPALDNQRLLRTLGIRAKLTLSQPADPDEHEADRAAEAFVGGEPIARQCVSCPPAAEEALRRKAAGPDRPRSSVHRAVAGLAGSAGRPLPPGTRGPFERFFGAGLAHVRVHDNAAAADAARAIDALAFTRGADVYFDAGRFAPSTREGQRLLAHELFHARHANASSLQRQAASPSPAPGATDVSLPAGHAVSEAVRNHDLAAAVEGLRNRSIVDLQVIRETVLRENRVRLERWLLAPVQRASFAEAARDAATVLALVTPGLGAGEAVATRLREPGRGPAGLGEEGVRLLLPALSLLDRLEIYDEGYRELEQAQIDLIRSASAAERAAAAREPDRLRAVYRRLSAAEEYEARLLIDPADRYEATAHLIDRAQGFVTDEEDPVFNAFMELTPADRRRLWNTTRLLALRRLLSGSQFALVHVMVVGTEAQTLVARLRLATEGRLDDPEGIRTVVQRARQLLAEQRQLRAQLAAVPASSADRETVEARLRELGDLESLLQFDRSAGPLDETSFMGRLAAASGPDEFGALALQLGADPFEAAKQRILLADGALGVDAEAIERAVFAIHAPSVPGAETLPLPERQRQQRLADNALRQRVLDDPQVAAVIARLDRQGPTGSIYVRRIQEAAQATEFTERLAEFGDALNRGDWGTVFRLTLAFARNAAWRESFEATASDPFGSYARVHGEPRRIMLEILRTGHLPVAAVLAYSSDVEHLRTALSQLDEGERGRLRLGYVLSRQGTESRDPQDDAALRAFRELEEQIRGSQQGLGVDRRGVQDVLDAVLGSEPTQGELATAEGRYRAAAVMYHRQEERLGLERGVAQRFTETDETMIAAHRSFAALWERLRGPRELSETDFAALAALHDRFAARAHEFSEASDAAGEVAGMVAATVAGILVIVASGGTATPGVVAAAAAFGAGSRVAARELFGGEYYEAVSAAGGRDAVRGAVDAALVVVGASLGAKGAQLLGLSGGALARGAARVGGEVAEEAAQSLGRRVLASSVEAAIDGAFSGAVSEAAGAITDARTWRHGAWRGIVRVGEAALLGGATGLVTGAVVGAVVPVLAEGARAAFAGIAGAATEQTLARAGASETLAAARRAARSGEYEEARRLFAELERHLEPSQASALWRELGSIRPAGVLLEVPVQLQSGSHTLRLVQTERGAVLVLCSWCTKVIDIVDEAIADAARTASPDIVARLRAMRGQVQRMEANIARGLAREDTNTLRNLLGVLSEVDQLAPRGGLLAAIRPPRVSFAGLASDPRVAARADELFPDHYRQLWESRRQTFRGGGVRDQLRDEVEREARARALVQAQQEIHPGARALDPGAPPRTVIDPAVDFPMGFYDRAGFDDFSRRLYAQLPDPNARLVLEGSAVTGRRFERAVDFGPTGAPFDVGRLSDYDVAIVSDALYRDAERLGVPLSGGGVARTEPLRPIDLEALGLTHLDTAARAAVTDATGLAHKVNFKVYSTHGGGAASLPLPR